MDFYQQMQQLRDGMAGLPALFGHPEVRSLVIRRMYFPDGETVPRVEFIEINPRPRITFVSPRTIAAFQSVSDVQITMDDFQVKGISTAYTAEQLGKQGTGYSYFVDGVLNNDRTAVVSGIECDFVGMTLGSTITWDMVLRRRPDGR